MVRAIGAGANGYITKRSAPEQLVNAIRKVHAGGRYLSDTAAESLAQHLATGHRCRTMLDSLSNREIQVLRHLALGHTVREIAQAYYLSPNTVHKAFVLADQVVLLRAGRVAQAGTPQELYAWPRSEFAARFLGMENILKARLVEQNGRCYLETVLGRWPAPDEKLPTGAHLEELARLAEAPLAERLADARRLAAVYAEVLRAPFVTVAAVHGAAYGGGLGLAAACDVVIAAPDARLQFSEVRLGFVPALISVFLTRRVPAARLAHLFLDPAPMDGVAGLAAGLVDEVSADPLARAKERALHIAATASPAAVASTKRLLLHAQFPALDTALEDAARVNAEQRAHPECRRGVAHFLSKRSFPDWLEGD